MCFQAEESELGRLDAGADFWDPAARDDADQNWSRPRPSAPSDSEPDLMSSESSSESSSDSDDSEDSRSAHCSDGSDSDADLPATAALDTKSLQYLVPLYGPFNASADLNVLEMIELLSSLQNEHNLSLGAMQTIHSVLQVALPASHSLPSYHTIETFKKKTSSVLPEIHLICINGCEALKNQSACSRCYQPVEFTVPFTGVQIQSQLQALMHRPDLKDDWLLQLTPAVDGLKGSLYSSPGWREQIIDDAKFSSNRRNIVLGFANDSFDAYNDKTNPFPCNPLMLVVYNLPKNKRHLVENMIVAGIVPPRLLETYKYGKPEALDGYFEVVVDELLKAWDPGLQFTSATGSSETLQLKLIHQIGDYPGQTETSKQTSHTGENGYCIYLINMA